MEYIEGQVKERLSIYRQHIRQPKYKKVEVIGHLRACAKEIFKMKENNKILRECYKDHLIRKFKSDIINQSWVKTSVVLFKEEHYDSIKEKL